MNPRKEFFNIKLAEIREVIEKREIDTHWTMKAEAAQYRESLSLYRDSKLETV